MFFRRVYSILDLLAELGGLFGTFNALSYILVFLMQYHGVYQFIMADLFVMKENSVKRSKNEIETDPKVNDVQFSPCNALRHNCLYKLPSKCACLCKKPLRK